MNKHLIPNTHTFYFTEALLNSLPTILQRPITIIEAPMGYGKTVAVREYLCKADADVVWVSLSSRLESSRWNLFCRAFEEAYPEHSQAVHRLRILEFPRDDQTIDEMLRILQEIKLERPLVIVLDDYHLVNTLEMSRLVEILVQSNIEHLHSVLISRDAYQGNAEFLHLKRCLTIIGKEHFVLQPEDIIVYYRQYGLALSENEAQLLYRHTEGWISALYLYLLRYYKEGIIAFPVSIYELMDREIFAPLASETKSFLLALCPLKSFTFVQADYLWRRGNTHELIQELRSKNAFITYDDQKGSFSIHRIFLQFLERVFQRLPENIQQEYQVNCGDWFYQNQEYYQAICFYYRGKDYCRIMQTIEADKGACITLERWPFFTRILASCPEEIPLQDPGAFLILMISAYLVNDGCQFEKLFAALEAFVQTCSADDPKTSELLGVLSFADSFRQYNDIEAMAASYQAAYTHLGQKVALFAGNMLTWTMGAPSMLLMFHRKSGALAVEIELMKKHLPFYIELTQGRGIGGEYLMEAEQRLYAGDLETAKIISYTAETTARQHNKPGSICCAKFLQMRLAIFDGDARKLALLRKDILALVEDAHPNERKLLRQRLKLCEGFIYSVLDKPELIPSWLRYDDPQEKQLYLLAYPMAQIISGRSMLLAGEYVRIIGTFSALVREPLYACHALFCIYANVYIAAAQGQLGRKSEARSSLYVAMDIAFPDQLYLPFVENYPYLQLLFKAFTPSLAYQEGIEKIVDLADAWQKGLMQITFGSAKRKDILTKREKELASLVCAGKTNRQVAEELFLAPSTVKRALVSIYRKLGINSRTELPRYLDKFE